MQGNTLASYIFVIELDYAFRIAICEMEDLRFRLVKRLSRRVKTIILTDCDFADDDALLSEYKENVQSP